jgi:UDP-N-acetylglucosamine acyltransferase
MSGIHPTAIIDPQAVLAPDVSVGPFCVIEGPVVVGAGSRLYQSVYLSGDTQLGENCIVHPYCCIGHVPQDHSFKPETASSVRIGAHCEFREGVTIHRGASEGSATIIGDHAYFMAYSHVAHNCVVGNNVTFANGALVAGYASIGDRAFLSGNVTVHQHAHIGRFAMISASTFINKDIPPFCVAQRVPAVVAGLNVVGMRRGDIGPAERALIKQAYRIIYRSGFSVSTAAEHLEKADNPYAAEFREFIRASSRGLTRGRNDVDE